LAADAGAAAPGRSSPRLAPASPKAIEWKQIVDDLADLSHVEVEQDSKRAACHPFARRSRPPSVGQNL
jgi:hypothetical protein